MPDRRQRSHGRRIAVADANRLTQRCVGIQFAFQRETSQPPKPRNTVTPTCRTKEPLPSTASTREGLCAYLRADVYAGEQRALKPIVAGIVLRRGGSGALLSRDQSDTAIRALCRLIGSSMHSAPALAARGDNRLQLDARQRPRRLCSLAGGPRLALARGGGVLASGAPWGRPHRLGSTRLVRLGCLGATQRHNLVQPRVPGRRMIPLSWNAVPHPTCRPPARRMSAAFGTSSWDDRSKLQSRSILVARGGLDRTFGRWVHASCLALSLPRLARVDAVVGQAPLTAIRGHLAATHRRRLRGANSDGERNYSTDKNGAHMPLPATEDDRGPTWRPQTGWGRQPMDDCRARNAKGTNRISLRQRTV